MIVTIISSEIKQGAKGDYLSVKYLDHKDNSEHGKAVFSTLKEKWGMVINGCILELKQDATYKIIDILPPPETPPPTKPQPMPQPVQLNSSPVKPPDHTETPPTQPIGAEIGMTIKELGDLLRANLLYKVFGDEAGTNLLKWYQGRILGTTKVAFDSAKLPPIKVKEISKDDKNY